MWKLVIEDDEGKRTVVPLTRDDYTIGRKEGNTIRLTERNVSRDHAKLVKRMNGGGAPGFVLEDMTSYNGVYVNGLRVAHSQELQHGDLIQIGDYRIILQDEAVADQPASVVPATDPKSTMPTGLPQHRGSLMMERPNRMVMLAGPTPGAEYPLLEERMTIGRAEDASISINHNSVSRLHCEVHALGDGRYEIVDKGSSNGVRVNSADLRRGIIEAGDVIELGDVKFKFVGAGQIFRPGATESQQLAAIGDRTASQLVGRKRTSALPYVLFAGVVLVGGALVFFFTRPKTNGTAPVASTAATISPEQSALDDAKKMCLQGTDCDGAHERLMRDVPKDSPLRQSPDFKGIEIKWANALLTRAHATEDPDKRQKLLDTVAKADDIDPALRKQAQKELEELDEETQSADNLPLAQRDAGGYDAGLHRKWDAGAKPFGYDAGLAMTAPSETTTQPTGTGGFDQERQQVLAGQKDNARAALQARVYSGQASPQETMLLRSLCREVGDKTCVMTCNNLLGAPKPTPSH